MTATAMPEDDFDDVWLTEKQVSRITGLSPATLQRMRANPLMGGPPSAKTGPSRTSPVRYSRKRLYQWMQDCERGSTSNKGDQ